MASSPMLAMYMDIIPLSFQEKRLDAFDCWESFKRFGVCVFLSIFFCRFEERVYVVSIIIICIYII